MWVNQSACARKFTFIHGQRLYTAFTLPLHCLYTAFILPLHGRARITVNPYKTCKGIYSNFFKFPFGDRAAIISNQYMSFFTNSSGLTITGGNFTSISLSKQDAGRFYFHLKPYYCHYWKQPTQHKYRRKERTVIVVNLIMLRLMTSGRGVGAGV